MYDIKEIEQVPNVNNGCRVGPTRNRTAPTVRQGQLRWDGRLLVVINWNTDLGDAWEWAEQACYLRPLDLRVGNGDQLHRTP
jgi:hypothetical protein